MYNLLDGEMQNATIVGRLGVAYLKSSETKTSVRNSYVQRLRLLLQQIAHFESIPVRRTLAAFNQLTLLPPCALRLDYHHSMLAVAGTSW